MTTAAWLSPMIAWIVAVASPGPDMFLLLRLGVRARRPAVLGALGIMTGNALWIVTSVRIRERSSSSPRCSASSFRPGRHPPTAGS
ncbi:hypothetical protein [Leucobacter sp. Psy1]|uniref:hypothetical protein n=1 Tax=Leucobacter sp. Psy1 TaxID=2875729 RepID=UPI001CD6CDCF|nr:hypothetical protein [Leucobacter sp. Psy1]